MSQLPQSLFYSTPAQRVALARQRYFEEGQWPSGIVSDAVLQSWARCDRAHADPRERVEFQPVTVSRSHLALQRNRHLVDAWNAELPQVQAGLAATSCTAMLSDASGVLIAAAFAGRSHERLMPVAARVGVNLSEEAIGTTAPGIVTKTGQPVCVLGGEHYFEGIHAMHCAAAPIRDIAGRLAGVLDISSESVPFNFDPAAVIALYAGAIENRLLIAQAVDHLVLKIQLTSPLIDTPLVGLVGIDTTGLLSWTNGVAKRLLGTTTAPPEGSPPRAAEEVFGIGLSGLASLPRTGAAPLRLPNGLSVWARCEMRARDGRQGLLAATAGDARPADVAAVSKREAPASLRVADRDHIVRTLHACGGNVSAAAKRLGVSRGLIYRRLGTRAALAP
jgi:transcriptional regulator of acetoin/glycerol metabolism